MPLGELTTNDRIIQRRVKAILHLIHAGKDNKVVIANGVVEVLHGLHPGGKPATFAGPRPQSFRSQHLGAAKCAAFVWRTRSMKASLCAFSGMIFLFHVLRPLPSLLGGGVPAKSWAAISLATMAISAGLSWMAAIGL